MMMMVTVLFLTFFDRHTMLKLLSPLLAHLTLVGKARELLAVLESPSDLTTSVCEDHLYTECGEQLCHFIDKYTNK